MKFIKEEELLELVSELVRCVCSFTRDIETAIEDANEEVSQRSSKQVANTTYNQLCGVFSLSQSTIEINRLISQYSEAFMHNVWDNKEDGTTNLRELLGSNIEKSYMNKVVVLALLEAAKESLLRVK